MIRQPLRLLLKRNKVIQNSFLILFGIVLGIILIEILLTVLGNPFGFRLKGDKIVLPANQTYTIHNTKIDKLDEHILHLKNSMGFRGPELPENVSDSIKIIAIGGSTTENFYLSEGQTWVDRLDFALQETGGNFWINNAGLDGQSTFGHQVLLEDYVIQLQPHYILLLVGINDVALNTSNAFDREILQQSNSAEGVINWLANKSEVVALAYNLFRFSLTRNSVGHTNLQLAELPHLAATPSANSNYLNWHQEQFAPAYAQRLSTLITFAKQHHIEPILITQPALYGGDLDPVTGVNLNTVQIKNNIDGATAWALLEIYNEATRRIGRQHNVTVVELAQRLPKSSLYFYDFIHYSPAGNTLVGDTIYDEICPIMMLRVAQSDASCEQK